MRHLVSLEIVMKGFLFGTMLIVVIILITSNGINGECQLEDSYLEGKYYVVGLYKMFTNYDRKEYDENAIRLHLRLR